MITKQDMINRFGKEELAERTDRTSYQSIDDEVLNSAISDAETEAESYLRAAGLVARNSKGELVYIQSVTTPKPLIIKTCDIARFYLYENGVTEIVQKRYDQAITWLKLVMRNPAMLIGKPNAGEHQSGGIAVKPNEVPSLYDWD